MKMTRRDVAELLEKRWNCDQCCQHHYQKGRIITTIHLLTSVANIITIITKRERFNTTIHLLTIVILILVFPNQEDSVTHPTM